MGLFKPNSFKLQHNILKYYWLKKNETAKSIPFYNKRLLRFKETVRKYTQLLILNGELEQYKPMGTIDYIMEEKGAIKVGLSKIGEQSFLNEKYLTANKENTIAKRNPLLYEAIKILLAAGAGYVIRLLTEQ